MSPDINPNLQYLAELALGHNVKHLGAFVRVFQENDWGTAMGKAATLDKHQAYVRAQTLKAVGPSRGKQHSFSSHVRKRA